MRPLATYASRGLTAYVVKPAIIYERRRDQNISYGQGGNDRWNAQAIYD